MPSFIHIYIYYMRYSLVDVLLLLRCFNIAVYIYIILHISYEYMVISHYVTLKLGMAKGLVCGGGEALD